MTKKERLEAIIKHYCDGKNSIFANFLGVAPSTISSWLSRDTLDYDLIFAKCKGISPEWLLSGIGNMLKSEKQGISADLVKTDPQKGESYIPPTAPIDSIPVAKPVANGTPCEGIPLIPLSAMAGALTAETSVLEYECERYVIPAFKGADFLIPVKGDSMLPTYKSGDIVACQRTPLDGIFFQWNKTYILDTRQGALIKRVKQGSDKQHILIVSDNKEYDPFELPYSEINAVALVLGLLRLE